MDSNSNEFQLLFTGDATGAVAAAGRYVDATKQAERAAADFERKMAALVRETTLGVNPTRELSASYDVLQGKYAQLGNLERERYVNLAKQRDGQIAAAVAAREAAAINESYGRTVQTLSKDIALGARATHQQRLEWELEHGSLKELDSEKKQHIRLLGQERQAQIALADATKHAASESRRAAALRAQVLQSAGQGMQSAGRAMTYGVSLPVIAGAAYSVNKAIEYESAFAGVRKTVNASEAELARLEARFKSMSLEIPRSAAELAHIGEIAGALGVRGSELEGFVRTVAMLGDTTNLGLDEGATGLARLATVMQVTQGQTSNLGSALVALGNDGASTESEILAMALRIAGTGKTLNMTAGDVLGLSNALSSVGIEAEMGGSAISRVMMNMAQSVSKGSDDLKVYAAVSGQTVEQFRRGFEQSAAKALTAFVEGLGRARKAGVNLFDVLKAIGADEVRMRDTLLRVANAGDTVAGSIQLGNKAFRENTAMQKEFDVRAKTTASQMKLVKNALDDAVIALGQDFADALKESAPMIKDLIGEARELVRWFNNLSPEAKKVGFEIAALAVAAGPVTGLAGILTGTIGGASKFVNLLKDWAKVATAAKDAQIALNLASGGGSGAAGVASSAAKFGWAGAAPWVTRAGGGLAAGGFLAAVEASLNNNGWAAGNMPGGNWGAHQQGSRYQQELTPQQRRMLGLPAQVDLFGNPVRTDPNVAKMLGYQPATDFFSPRGFMGPQFSPEAAQKAKQTETIKTDVAAIRRAAEQANQNARGGGARASEDYKLIAAFARSLGGTVTSTTGGRHMKGSEHYKGRAADAVFSGDPRTWPVEWITALAAEHGIEVIDERTRKSNEWTNPHLHFQTRKGASLSGMGREDLAGVRKAGFDGAALEMAFAPVALALEQVADVLTLLAERKAREDELMMGMKTLQAEKNDPVRMMKAQIASSLTGQSISLSEFKGLTNEALLKRVDEIYNATQTASKVGIAVLQSVVSGMGRGKQEWPEEGGGYGAVGLGIEQSIRAAAGGATQVVQLGNYEGRLKQLQESYLQLTLSEKEYQTLLMQREGYSQPQIQELQRLDERNQRLAEERSNMQALRDQVKGLAMDFAHGEKSANSFLDIIGRLALTAGGRMLESSFDRLIGLALPDKKPRASNMASGNAGPAGLGFSLLTSALSGYLGSLGSSRYQYQDGGPFVTGYKRASGGYGRAGMPLIVNDDSRHGIESYKDDAGLHVLYPGRDGQVLTSGETASKMGGRAGTTIIEKTEVTVHVSPEHLGPIAKNQNVIIERLVDKAVGDGRRDRRRR